MAGRDAEPPVQEVSPKSRPPGRPRVPSYRVMLDVPVGLIWFVSGLLAARRRSIGPGKRPVSWAATGRPCSGWPGSGTKAASSGSARASACRRPRLTATSTRSSACWPKKAPGLREALERALPEGTPYVILDGKIVDADRCHEKTLSRKGKESTCGTRERQRLGGNIRAVFYRTGGRCRPVPGSCTNVPTKSASVVSAVQAIVLHARAVRPGEGRLGQGRLAGPRGRQQRELLVLPGGAQHRDVLVAAELARLVGLAVRPDLLPGRGAERALRCDRGRDPARRLPRPQRRPGPARPPAPGGAGGCPSRRYARSTPR